MRDCGSIAFETSCINILRPKFKVYAVIELKQSESRPEYIDFERPSPNVVGKRRCHGSHEQKQALKFKDQVRHSLRNNLPSR